MCIYIYMYVYIIYIAILNLMIPLFQVDPVPHPRWPFFVLPSPPVAEQAMAMVRHCVISYSYIYSVYIYIHHHTSICSRCSFAIHVFFTFPLDPFKKTHPLPGCWEMSLQLLDEMCRKLSRWNGRSPWWKAWWNQACVHALMSKYVEMSSELSIIFKLIYHEYIMSDMKNLR